MFLPLRVICGRPLAALALGAVLALPLAPSLHAEEGPEGEDPRQKLKAQVEKVLRLMRENEEALLKASTQGGEAPKGPEVPIPDVPPGPPPPQGQPQGNGGTGGSGQGGTGQGGSGQGGTGQGGAGQGGGSAGAEGEEARLAMEELLKGAGEGGASGRIPGELEELIRMVPQGSGGGGSGEGQGGGKGEQESPEAREAERRKQLEEQQRREQEKSGQKPEGGQRNPNDPGERAEKDPEDPPPAAQDPNVKSWHAALPPELREFFAGGGLEKLPPRLRKIVEDYQRSLDRQTRPPEGTPR